MAATNIDHLSGIERAAYFYRSDGRGVRAMRLRMYFGKELPTDETIVRSNGIGLRRIDVSPAAVSALAVYKGIDDVLTAYDLYGIANEAPGANAAWDTPFAQRFIIGRRDLRQTSFFFQNSLGGFDTVTAKGVRSCQPEGETVSFTNGRTEEMLETGFTDTWEVNTGFIFAHPAGKGIVGRIPVIDK